jgi:desulfoferrodoxin (superoxide reductase-like protein)
MKPCPFWILCAGIILVLSIPLSAHPPTRMDLNYDDSSGILTITAQHPTQDVMKHFINRVEVQFRGKRIVIEEFTFQFNAEFHQAVCLLYGVRPGDEIQVTAQCNVFGKKTVSLVIPERKAP